MKKDDMRRFRSSAATDLHYSRRQFLKAATGVGLTAAGMALLESCGLNVPTQPVNDATLETTTIRLTQAPSVCLAPQYVAEDILKGEGFSDVQYVKMTTAAGAQAMVDGVVDISMFFAGPLVIRLDAGDPIVGLAGVHVGCFVLFGSERINTVHDLKGSHVAISELGGADHVFLSTMAAYVGLDPSADINWVTDPKSKQLFIDGKVDAFLAFPPVAQELRAKQIGHPVVNSMMDTPWSGYYCCMIAANRAFAQKNPEATKRVVRSILKAADICSQDPARAARMLVDRGYTADYDIALEALKEIPYGMWRRYDPIDTLRFYALRLREAGMVTGSPEGIIAKGTDWHFLDAIKKEL